MQNETSYLQGRHVQRRLDPNTFNAELRLLQIEPKDKSLL